MSTRDEILAAAVKEVRERDEAAFRVTIVARNAGCATSVLYHYFGSREGLIDAALVEIVYQLTETLREFARGVTAIINDSSDVVSLMTDYARFAHSPDRRPDRALRARLIGLAQTRPAVRDALQAMFKVTKDANEEMLMRLLDRGLIREDVDIPSVTLMMRALDFGWVLDDLDEVSDVSFDRWMMTMETLARHLARTD